MTYIIRDREDGNMIEIASTLEEAQMILRRFEEEDRREGTYEEGFYEIAIDHGYRR